MGTWNERLEETSRQGDLHAAQGQSDGVGTEELRRLESIYVFRRPEEVSRFLESNSYLSPILIEAYEKIGEHFGSRPEVALEVVRDPEVRGLIQMFGYYCHNADAGRGVGAPPPIRPRMVLARDPSGQRRSKFRCGVPMSVSSFIWKLNADG